MSRCFEIQSYRPIASIKNLDRLQSVVGTQRSLYRFSYRYVAWREAEGEMKSDLFNDRKLEMSYR